MNSDAVSYDRFGIIQSGESSIHIHAPIIDAYVWRDWFCSY
jgi:hypothetical protein